MFKRSYFFSLCFLCLVTIALCFRFLSSQPTDKKKYQNIVEHSLPKTASDTVNFSKHTRNSVTKDIWLEKENSLQICIKSNISELFFYPEGKNFVVKEEMQGVCCIAQEELFYVLEDGREVVKTEEGVLRLRQSNHALSLDALDVSTLQPMQLIRYIQAKQASYDYQSGLLTAHQATLYQYKVPGHTLPDSIQGAQTLMLGEAEIVAMTLNKQRLDFKAHSFKATFELGDGML